MLSAEERAEFEERGVLRLAGAAERKGVDGLRGRLEAYVRERGLIPPDAPPGFTIHASKTARLMRQEPFAPTWGPRALGAVDALLGAGRWQVPRQAGQLLAVSQPLAGTSWRLPHGVWHLDYMAPGGVDGLPGVQLFLPLDRVEPRSGATLVASGTHRLIEALRCRRGAGWPGRSAEVRKELGREVPWLRELWRRDAGDDRIARFMECATEFAGVRLQVLELVGEPGDVIVMHPWVLHAPAMNCGARPRLVITERLRTLGT